MMILKRTLNISKSKSEELAYKFLVRRYANGREICNCGEGYYDSRGMCPSGCSSNQISTKHEIALKVLEEFGVNGILDKNPSEPSKIHYTELESMTMYYRQEDYKHEEEGDR